MPEPERFAFLPPPPGKLGRLQSRSSQHEPAPPFRHRTRHQLPELASKESTLLRRGKKEEHPGETPIEAEFSMPVSDRETGAKVNGAGRLQQDSRGAKKLRRERCNRHSIVSSRRIHA